MLCGLVIDWSLVFPGKGCLACFWLNYQHLGTVLVLDKVGHGW